MRDNRCSTWPSSSLKPQVIMKIMLIVWVTCHESSWRRDPHLFLPRHIRLEVRDQSGDMTAGNGLRLSEIVCFQAALQGMDGRHVEVSFWLYMPHGDKSVTVNNISARQKKEMGLQRVLSALCSLCVCVCVWQWSLQVPHQCVTICAN